MAKKTKSYPILLPYPEPQDVRSGCKVGWNIYGSMDEALICSQIAKNNAAIKASMGYDFGYQAPGSIDPLPDGRFEVCIP